MEAQDGPGPKERGGRDPDFRGTAARAKKAPHAGAASAETKKETFLWGVRIMTRQSLPKLHFSSEDSS